MEPRKVRGKSAEALSPHGMKFTPYQKRTYAFLGLWNEDAWALKVYGINHQAERSSGHVVDPAIVAAARARIRIHLPDVDREGDHHHTGFVILHQGIGGNWLLLHWWVQEAICSETLWKAGEESPTKFQVVTGSFMACVWELVVIDFERRAWVDTVLQRNGDRELYLRARLLDGTY